MPKCFSVDPARRGLHTLLSLLTISFMLANCGGGGDGSVSSQVVSGVASGGAPMAGQVTVKDASAQQRATVIGSGGSFALDVTSMKGPFVLEATGTVNGVNYKMFSFADSMGTANVNPLGNAALAYAARVNDPEEIYKNPDPAMLDRVRAGLPQALADLRAKLKPLLMLYGADSADPIKGPYKADHTGLDGLFDDVKFTLENGILTITNVKTGAVIFTCAITDVMSGRFTDDATAMPKAGSPPAAPTGVTATGGDLQVTISWAAVANATSYNIYWSTTPGVTPATGTKIAGAASPAVQTGLTAGTTYYYIVTAVNSAGEGPASGEVSAMTNAASAPGPTAPPPPAPGPTVPAAPTGVSAAGGTNQVTISWSAVTGATSYNLYWSTTSGVTPANGTGIAGVTSPAVQTGLTAGTTYYYVVTAVNSAGESAASIQVAATTLTPAPAPTVPASPTGVTAAGGASQVTVSWSPVNGATSYNLYWSITAGVTTTTGTRIAGVTSPYVQTGLSASTAYYYIVTAVNSVGESAPSAQATATTNAPPPAALAAPTGVTATGGAKQVTISWLPVAGATIYNLYWSTTSGVTVATGTKIAGVTSPYVQTGLADSTAYYYIVTAADSVSESPASAQVTATTSPPAFDGLAFYNANCVGCHGAPSTFTGGRTATQLQSAINSNLGGMGRFSTLTAAQVAAIAAILGP